MKRTKIKFQKVTNITSNEVSPKKVELYNFLLKELKESLKNEQETQDWGLWKVLSPNASNNSIVIFHKLIGLPL